MEASQENLGDNEEEKDELRCWNGSLRVTLYEIQIMGGSSGERG